MGAHPSLVRELVAFVRYSASLLEMANLFPEFTLSEEEFNSKIAVAIRNLDGYKLVLIASSDFYAIIFCGRSRVSE